jgi:rubrerythrin
MPYKCPQCGQTAEQEGNCPTCNVPLEEETEETTPSEAPEEPTGTE